jgi:hypothetical protein
LQIYLIARAERLKVELRVGSSSSISSTAASTCCAFIFPEAPLVYCQVPGSLQMCPYAGLRGGIMDVDAVVPAEVVLPYGPQDSNGCVDAPTAGVHWLKADHLSVSFRNRGTLVSCTGLSAHSQSAYHTSPARAESKALPSLARVTLPHGNPLRKVLVLS